VIAAVADERELRAVGRPLRVRVVARRLDERLLALGDARRQRSGDDGVGVDQAVSREGDDAPVR
jgi:hypothetical protein